MNQYETVFIVTPVLSDGEIKKSIQNVADMLKKEGAEIVHEDHWGLRQLAYPIQKKTTGIYHIIEYKADNKVVEKLEIAFKRNENIMRFLTIKLDKYSIEYNEKKRKGLIGVKKEVAAEPVNQEA